MRRLQSWLTDGVGFDVALMLAGLTFLILLAGLPLIYNVLMSFQQVDMFSLGSLIRPWAGLDNYRAILAQPEFLLVMKNTALFVFGSIAGQFVLGFALALYFNQNFPGWRPFAACFWCLGSCRGWWSGGYGALSLPGITAS